MEWVWIVKCQEGGHAARWNKDRWRGDCVRNHHLLDDFCFRWTKLFFCTYRPSVSRSRSHFSSEKAATTTVMKIYCQSNGGNWITAAHAHNNDYKRNKSTFHCAVCWWCLAFRYVCIINIDINVKYYDICVSRLTVFMRSVEHKVYFQNTLALS